MTVQTMVSTEALEPGDLVTHEDVPERLVTGRVAGPVEGVPGYVTVIWPGMTAVPVKSDRLHLVSRPDAYAVVHYAGDDGSGNYAGVEPYTFVITGASEDIEDDVAIYREAPGYRVVSFRLDPDDTTETADDDD